MEGALEAIWRSHSCAHFLWKSKCVHGVVVGHNGNIPFRERSAKVRLGVAKPNTASCLHGLTLESSLCLYSPSSLFSLSLSLPQRNPLNPQSDHTSPLLTILTGRVNARALTTSQASSTSLVFHTQLSSHQSPETHSLPIRSFLTWQPCSPFRF